MPDSIDNLVRDLRGTRDVNAHYKAIDGFVTRGEVDTAVGLARAVEERSDIGAPPWALEAVFDRVIRALALCNELEAASAALKLGLSSRTQSTQRARAPLATARNLAFLLATGQSDATLVRLLDQLGRRPD